MDINQEVLDELFETTESLIRKIQCTNVELGRLHTR